MSTSGCVRSNVSMCNAVGEFVCFCVSGGGLPPLSQCGGGGNTGRYTHMHAHRGTYKYTDKHKRRRHTNTERYTTHRAIQHTQIHTHGNRDTHTHNVWVIGCKEDQVFDLCVTADLYLPVFLCVSVDAISVRLLRLFCAVLYSHHHQLPAHTKFPFLS